MREFKKLTMSGLVAVAALCAQAAYADNCAALAGKQLCLTYVYSTGGSNSYTATFGSGGAFSLGGSSTGTYTCAGKNFTDVNYAFGGFETQSWYAKASSSGNALKGYGKSITNGYLYSFTSVPGACPAAAVRAPGASQRD